MEVRDTVLDSELEAITFQTLESRWSPQFKIFPALPLLKIFQVDSNELNPKELWHFNKAHLDYTLCSWNNQPILSIEFDGVRGGFSRDGVYLPELKIIDPIENHQIDLKLKIANRVNYPLLVISYEGLRNFDEEDTLTILFSIIRQLIVQEESPDSITNKAIEYEEQCAEFGLNKHKFDYLIDPPLFGIKNIFDEEIIQSQIKAMKQIVRLGCRFMVENSKIVIAQPVWIHNSELFEVNLLSMAKAIAKYLAFKRTYSLIVFRFKDSREKNGLS